ncbi:hypothetical protein JTE90_004050 [Oedothorax gibbosus]|uniref:Uncharacterized protein n=1 Tax=Oedothorax gibbosus TaxID=931172 RepID=A0AAV6U5A2_9ARAC|nr:hypothetical protein JTE90_004050 [Oedothorax gibbosus]
MMTPSPVSASTISDNDLDLSFVTGDPVSNDTADRRSLLGDEDSLDATVIYHWSASIGCSLGLLRPRSGGSDEFDRTICTSFCPHQA